MDETFQQSGKQDSFRHILEIPASTVCMKFSSKFFRTTGIQSGLDAFDGFVMTFFIILGVAERLCSFRIVPEGKKGK